MPESVVVVGRFSSAMVMPSWSGSSTDSFPARTGPKPLASVRHEQARLHLFLPVGVEVPDGLQPRTEILRQPVDPGAVDLHEVAGRIADVELDNIARQFDEPVVERHVIEGVVALRSAVDRLEIVDGDPEMVVAGGLDVAF